MTLGTARATQLAAGLYLIATPIGAARDITLRALDILNAADILVAEDTRSLRHLMEIHGIAVANRALLAYHDHSDTAALNRILQAIATGKSVAFASEAGTPLISDPGYELGRAVIAAGLPMVSAPGPTAAICALTLSGLPSDRFLFAGFPPSQSAARRSFLDGLKEVQATVILYESPKRIHKLLGDMCDILGEARQGAICRELTKKFEEISRGTLSELVQAYAGRDIKGEIVVLVDRAASQPISAQTIEAALTQALASMSVKDAVAAVASAYGAPRREVYQMALDRGRR